MTTPLTTPDQTADLDAQEETLDEHRATAGANDVAEPEESQMAPVPAPDPDRHYVEGARQLTRTAKLTPACYKQYLQVQASEFIPYEVLAVYCTA